MFVEILIFVALAGIIIIIGRKIPAFKNRTDNFKDIIPKSTNFFNKKEKPMISDDDFSRHQKMNKSSEKNDDKEIDELLKNIDFNEDGNSDFWEPSFFDEAGSNKISTEEKVDVKESKKFKALIKDIPDQDLEKKKIESIDEKKSLVEPAKDEKKYEPKEEAFSPKRNLPKVPLSIGLTTDLTLRDLLLQANNSFAAKNYHTAEEFYIKAASLDPNNPSIYSRLGVIYLTQGKYADAKESLKFAINLDGSNATLYYNLSVTCIKLGERDEAVGYLKKCVALEPDNQKYHDVLKQIV
ncbi:MAG: tetratricopeptide repeat protein [Patescibacteria group bacterium]